MKFITIIVPTLIALTLDQASAQGSIRGSRQATAQNQAIVTTDEESSSSAIMDANDETPSRMLTLGYGYDGYHNHACRTHDDTRGREGCDYDLYRGYSHYDCESLCNSLGSRCQAYETGSSHCEIWYTYPPKTGHASGLGCYKKNNLGGVSYETQTNKCRRFLTICTHNGKTKTGMMDRTRGPQATDC